MQGTLKLLTDLNGNPILPVTSSEAVQLRSGESLENAVSKLGRIYLTPYSYTFNDLTNTFNIPTSQYNPDFNQLVLYHKGLILSEGVNYSIVGNDITFGFTTSIGDTLEYHVYSKQTSNIDGEITIGTYFKQYTYTAIEITSEITIPSDQYNPITHGISFYYKGLRLILGDNYTLDNNVMSLSGFTLAIGDKLEYEIIGLYNGPIGNNNESVDLTLIENQLGDETLTTTSQTIKGAINELSRRIDNIGTNSGGSAKRWVSYYVDGNLAVETSVFSVLVPINANIDEVRLAVAEAPTGADLIIDIRKNGNTIFTTEANKPTIKTGTISAISVAPDITTILAGDKLTLDILQVGTITTGLDLSVTVGMTEI